MGIIEKQDDIVNSIEGISKGNLSTFKKTGKYGPGFKTKFQRTYDLNLADFNPDTYDLVSYVIEKSGPSTVPDYNLLTQLKKQADELIISLRTFSSSVDASAVEGEDLASASQEIPLDKSLIIDKQ